jgi:hypothetical protein
MIVPLILVAIWLDSLTFQISGTWSRVEVRGSDKFRQRRHDGFRQNSCGGSELGSD